MFRTATLFALTCTLAIPFVAVRADDATSKPSTQPAGEVIDVKDFAKLKEMIGTEVTIRGKVTEVFVPKSASVSIFNFDGIGRRDFNVVIPKASLDAVNAAFDGDVAKAVTNETISVTGKVADYRGNPQIQLEKPESLKIEKAEEEKKE
jgi:DNA/RNA endonuclease YhcR with UshA esterase domain